MSDFPETKQKGDLVEGYRVMSEIGRGAASIIYLVQDPKSKQVWALKHVRKQSAKDQRWLDQAEQEQKIASQLDHRSIRRIPRIIKKGSLLSVRELYLVMELVDGLSLERYPLKTFEEATDVFSQVAQGLAHMHERGFVHADMKPNNIVVGNDLEGNVVAKIIDLGQSCKNNTVKPRIQGTPDYIAPEQVHRRPITPKTDIYNFGATMYWALTRQHIPTALPKGESLVGSLDDNLIERPRPAIELNPRIHAKLNELVMRCVEVDPDDRPESMDWVAGRLELILGILRGQREARDRGEGSAAGIASLDDEED